MNKAQAAEKKAKWLSYCLEIGWDKSELDSLSEIWDEHKDEYGNLRPAKPKVESTSPALLIKALKEIAVYIRHWNEANHSFDIDRLKEIAEEALSSFESIQTSEEKEYREVIDDFQQDEYCKDIIAMVEYQPSILHQIAGIKELFIITKRDGNE